MILAKTSICEHVTAYIIGLQMHIYNTQSYESRTSSGGRERKHNAYILLCFVITIVHQRTKLSQRIEKTTELDRCHMEQNRLALLD